MFSHVTGSTEILLDMVCKLQKPNVALCHQMPFTTDQKGFAQSLEKVCQQTAVHIIGCYLLQCQLNNYIECFALVLTLAFVVKSNTSEIQSVFMSRYISVFHILFLKSCLSQFLKPTSFQAMRVTCLK